MKNQTEFKAVRSKIQTMAVAAAMFFVFVAGAHATVEAEPSRVNFGSEAVGSTSESRTVTLTNENRHSITISRVSESAEEFLFEGPSFPVTLRPGERLRGSVTFKPSAAQSFFGKLHFIRANGVAISIALSGIGTGTPPTPAVAPTISAQPASAKIIAGQKGTFNVAATGTAPISYQWMKNGAALSGATSSNYTTPPATIADNNAQFSVALSNSAGNATSTPATLVVTSAAVAPAITAQPASQTIASGKTATFNVAATGTAPLTYQWSKGGVAISGATSSSYTTPAETAGAQFAVTVSNSAGTASSNAATLTVSSAAVAPAITAQPASQTIASGKTATFNVAATGTAPLTYQWSKGGVAISGATSSSYTTPAETAGAQFAVTVSNSAGTASSNAATLTVSSAAVAPAITAQPASQTIASGKTATFNVTATGTAPLTYQWSKGGVAISGATSSSYTTPAETAGAQFAVTVSNSAGTASSNTAALTVTASTLLLNSSASSLSFGSVNVSATGTQTVTLTNAGNSSVTISNVSVSGAGFNASGASGVILNPGQATTLAATFTPSAAGRVTGKVSVASNASNSPGSVSLSGTGVAVAVNHSVALSWSSNPSTVMGYNTYSAQVSGGPYTKLTSAPVSGTSYTYSAVTTGQTYYFVVTAIDSSNAESAYSAEVSALVP